MNPLLADLGLEAINPAAWSAHDGWLADPAAALIESVNPANGELIASVRAATPAQYERVMASARAVAEAWRQVPAPKRGEAVRLVGDELRRHKAALGSLVTLEMGKIKPEGDGEVQEMIDIADFAVGQSRMLYGLSMHSERPSHRMLEQWHPLGVVGVISAFNFPVAVWAWNAFLAAICGNVTVWKPSPKTALCAIAVQRLCNRVLERHGYPGIFQLFVDAGHELGYALRRGPPRGPRVVHGLDAGGARRGRARGATSRQEPARARRQQRHHRGRVGQSRPRRAVDRVRRGGHGRSALHQHAPRVRAPLPTR